MRLADLDRDGDLDMYILERDGRIATYRNEGSARSARFVPVDNDLLGVAILRWFLFADLDRDGALDILAEPDDANATIGFFRNVGGGGIASFEQTAAPFLDSAQVSLALGNTPAFEDLDADGDLDMFYIEPTNGIAGFHENVGTATQPMFASQRLGYGGINTFSTGSLARRLRAESGVASEERHGISIPALVDVDRDQDLDLFIGDAFNSNLWYFRNDGRPDSAAFTMITSQLLEPAFGGAYVSTIWSVAADIDGDADVDLLVAPNDESGALERNVFLYDNEGPADTVSFVFASDSLVAGVDLGVLSRPALGDLDGDGDQDMILSRSTRLIPGGVQGLAYFENTGTARSPAFRRIDDPDPLSSIVMDGLDSPAPALADMDGDGDLDLLVGQGNKPRQVHYFENQGTRLEHVFVFVGVLLDEDNIRRRPDFLATPTVGDLDRDGDLDLLVGEYGSAGRAKLYHYRNLGSYEENPRGRRPLFEWVTTGADTSFGFDTFADSVTEYLVPLLIDSNCDGYLDIWIGSVDGRLREYRSRGAGDSLTYELVTNMFESIDVGRASAPALADIDDDGDLDLFVGEESGGVNFFRNRSGELTAVPQASVITLSWRALVPADAVFKVHRTEEGNSYETMMEIPASMGPEFLLHDTESVFPGNRYEYRIEASGVTLACASFGPVSASVPIPVTTVLAWSVLPQENGAMVRWTVSPPFRGLSFRLSRRDNDQFVVVAGADSVPGDANNAVFDAQGTADAVYRIEGFYQRAGTRMAIPDSLFAPAIIRGSISFDVHPPRPNPTRDATEFLLELPQSSNVMLQIFDASGRRVRAIGPAALGPGTQRINWDGRDEAGDELPAGNYFYRIVAGTRMAAGSLVRLR